MNSQRKVEIVKVNVEGYRRTVSGKLVPNKEALLKMLERAKPNADSVPYVPYGREIDQIMLSRKIQQAVLLAGPTGVGKSLLAGEIARRLEYPLVQMVCVGDMETQDFLSSNLGIQDLPVLGNGSYGTVRETIVEPSAISIAALSGEPVVVFIDEVHKTPERVHGVFHPILNERQLNLSMLLGIGEDHKFHQDTLIIFAMNPTQLYGRGIESFDPAVRQRNLFHIIIDAVTDSDKLMEITRANVGDLGTHQRTIERLCTMCGQLAAAVTLHEKNESIEASKIKKADTTIVNQINVAISEINECPSPRIVVATTKRILAGEPVEDAVMGAFLNPIMTGFNTKEAAALREIARLSGLIS